MLKAISKIQSSATLLYSAAEIEIAIDKMAKEINLVLNGQNPVFLCVMNGGMVISGKILTRLNFPLTVDTINISRYHNQTLGGKIHWQQKPETNLKNRTVLIVDDILDEGVTLQAIIDFCTELGAKPLYTAVLVNKKQKRKKPVIADFVAVEIENHYVFGYGMDYKGYLRNAAGIYACKV